MRYAGVGPRAAAVIVDGLIAGIGFMILVGVVSGQTYDTGDTKGVSLHGAAFLIWIVLALGYWIVLEAIWGTTVGKRVMNLRVLTRDGAPISWGQSVVRNVLRLVDGLPYVIPYLVGALVAMADDEKQRLGDRPAKTFVVYRD
jgi:uncharacterized RDD family membrane protein YckC